MLLGRRLARIAIHGTVTLSVRRRGWHDLPEWTCSLTRAGTPVAVATEPTARLAVRTVERMIFHTTKETI